MAYLYYNEIQYPIIIQFQEDQDYNHLLCYTAKKV